MTFEVSIKKIYAVLAIFAFIAIVIICRLIQLQIFDSESKTKEAIASRTVRFDTQPKRGTIYDRNGNVLAYSKEAKTVYANPSEIKNDMQVATKVAAHLGGNANDYVDLFKNKDLKFVYIKRRIDTSAADDLKQENLEGIYFQDDQKREYPYGSVAGQIIGSINVDGNGLCGVELYYDDILRGSSGRTVRQQGNEGMPIPGGVLQQTDVIDGQDIMLSIDIELQQKIEDTLIAWNKNLGSKSMNSVLMDPTNGEIYAAASLPLLNPSDLNNSEEGATTLKSISSTYEPGSTFKTLAATAILEDGVMTPDTQIFCPNSIVADDFVVKDAHDRADETFTLRSIIERSSNVGISLATEKYGWDKYHNKLLQYQIDKKTGVDYPGDTTGYMLEFDKWSRIVGYNVSFGQGVTVTPLQMCKFYSSLANNGYAKTPHFLMRYLQSEKDQDYDEEELIYNKQAVPVMVDILKGVITNGTGKKANIPGYGVAGKTGTGEMADGTGKYIKGIYYSSFVGFLANANIPMLCYVGGEKVPSEEATTPAWNEIMSYTIQRLNIAAEE